MIGTVTDPSLGQTELSIGNFLAECSIGDEIAIRNPHGGGLRFVMTTITDIGTESRSRFIYTAHSGDYGGRAWMRKTGRNARAQTGQTHLVEATAQVRSFIERFPIGVLGYFGPIPT